MYSSYRVRNHQTGSGPVVLRFTIQLRAGCNFKSLFMVFLFPLWITSFHLQARWTVFQPFICGLFFMFPVNVYGTREDGNRRQTFSSYSEVTTTETWLTKEHHERKCSCFSRSVDSSTGLRKRVRLGVTNQSDLLGDGWTTCKMQVAEQL